MSKYNNVNPGQYKLRGRERPGDGILHEQNKAAESMTEHELREQGRRAKSAKAVKKPGRKP
jgi:hypothetical protein